ncbi:MAG: 3'(2'),5'-bisphosphate nucleotidase [Chloroflexota bacterium]|nr:3'(2'),5'-bisphosphate nucleotidase [Chloroflexota bacterium]MDE2946028.1 3'(2'),5'-bisphosphate nucleotidase [Chloroflexota bacterium]
MQAILAAIRDAAKLCRLVQADYLSAETKTAGDHSEPVTIADYGSQAIICRALQQRYPDDAVVAEESGAQFVQLVAAEGRAQIRALLTQVLRQEVTEADLVAWLDFGAGRSAARTWVIDPIDGTKGFLAQRHYAIACGLLLDGQVSGGIVATPGYNDGEGALFYTRDGAAYRAPLAGGDGIRMTVSSRRSPDDIIAVQSYERYHASKSRMARARELAGLGDVRVLELDSMEKYALVACGDADLYMRLPREGSAYAHKIWDHAAGVALVRNSGGTITDLDGGPLDFSQGETLPNAGLIASNGACHGRVVEAVQRVMAE